MKLLEDEAHFFRAVSDQLVLAKFRKVDAVDHNVSGSERVQPAKNIYERRFSGAGGAHERNPFARSEEHTSELQSRLHLVCRLLLEKKKQMVDRLHTFTMNQSVRR